MAHLKPLSPKFPDSLRATLSAYPSEAESLLSLYSFSSATDEEASFLQFLQLVADVSFHLGTLAFAKGFSAAGVPTNIFCFNEPNPWPGLFQGKATHVLDVVFLFQNYNDKLPKGQREAAEAMGLDFARFVSGQKPWEVFEDKDGERCAKAYGPSEGEVKGVVVKDVVKGSDTGRKPEVVEIADKVGWDLLASVFVDFLTGKHLK
jgi:carboxylesterase type B